MKTFYQTDHDNHRRIISSNIGGIGNRIMCLYSSHIVYKEFCDEYKLMLLWPNSDDFSCDLYEILQIDDSIEIINYDDIIYLLCHADHPSFSTSIFLNKHYVREYGKSIDINKLMREWSNYNYVFNSLPWLHHSVPRMYVCNYCSKIEPLVRPSEQVCNKINNLNFDPTDCIGVHVRRGDRTGSVLHDIKLQKYFDVIDKFDAPNIFLSAEDNDNSIYRQFVDRYGKKRIHKYNVRGYNRSNQEHCFDAVVSFFILSMTNILIGGISTYSQMAAALGKKNIHILRNDDDKSQ
jgi:hypothetical protein